LKGLKFRDADPRDRQAVFEFCRKTWPGYGDYIPRVWSKWIRDAAGRLILAESDGVPVGLAKITDFGGGEIWLEGLRVDPSHRHHGIANAINLEVLRTLRQMKPRAVRFCTGASNRASRHLGEKFGFRLTGRLRYYWRKSRKGKIRGQPAGKEQLDEVYDYLVGSRFLRMTSGLIAEGWVFRELSRDLLKSYLSKRRVMFLGKSGALEGVAIYPYEENDRSLTLGFVDGNPESISALARNCMCLARALGLAYCSVSVPTRGFTRLVESAGYRRQGSMGQLVYQLDGIALRTRKLPRVR
jgi:RimJ/RimL family protein N-acetyltransferase